MSSVPLSSTSGLAHSQFIQLLGAALPYLPALLVGAWALSCFYSIFLHPLRNIPGPFLAKFTEAWRTYKYARGKWHEDVLTLHRKYGRVVRVSPNEVSIVDKEGIRRVFGHGTGTKKTTWYNTWQVPGIGASFFHSTEPAEHSFLRKRVSAAFSMSTVLSLEPEIQEVQDAVWAQLDDAARSGRQVDMHEWASYFAFDVVGKLALGAPIGFVKQATDVMDIIKSIHIGFYQMANMGYIPGQMFWINNHISKFILSLFATDFGKFHKWNSDQLAKRLAEPAEEKATRKRDMLDHFISMKEPDGSPATQGSILIEGGNIIGAGADTTSIGIRTVLAQLVLHPEDYLHVQQEVDHAYAQRPAEGTGRGLQYLATEKLPYLTACVKEALRLHPSILWQLPREAPAEGIDIAGHYIAPSATISMSPLAQNRDRGVFGASADEWRPARWIPGQGSTDSEIKEMDKYNVTFGYGPRVCVGKNLATVEIHKFIADFVHRYNACFINPYRPYVVKSQWFSYQADMFLKLELRDTVSKQA
ncbi:hypothetical protein Sste5346_010118 [Sporothrix stenoceras]|uniref:Cytochrome P450 n=1 Tax=Sporothrix stenoceras TaxID=5173 RepID=A0ABR3YIE9_9PEZI